MTIKHGNKMLREQQSTLREKARWLNIQLEEANEEIAKLRVTLTAKNSMLTGARTKTRKCLALMNDAMEMEVFKYTSEYMASRRQLEACEGLHDQFKNALRENAE